MNICTTKNKKLEKIHSAQPTVQKFSLPAANKQQLATAKHEIPYFK